MASRGDSPTLFAGQPWSAYYESLAVGGVDEAKDGPPLPDVDAAGDEGGSMKLRKDDATIFGICPSLDEFYLTVCEHCNAVIKPQALMGHIEGRHKGTTNDSRPLEHLATNKEPPLKRSHKSKGKLNDKVAPQNLMAKYVLPKAPPNCHPNGKPKSALAEQLSKVHPPRLSKQPDSASAAAAAGLLSAATRKLLPPQPPPPTASPRLLLPPPPPHPAPPTETPQPKAPGGQSTGVQQSAIVTSTSAAGHRKDGHSVRDSPTPRIGASSAKQPSPLPSVSSSGATALSQPSAAAMAAATASAAATAAAAAVAALAGSCSERHELPKAVLSRPETLLATSVRSSDYGKISGDTPRGTCGAVGRGDSTSCSTAAAAVWAETSVAARPDVVGSQSSPFAGGESFCGSASRASDAAATAKLTELASADDSRSDAVLEPSSIAVAGCMAIEDGKRCKQSPESVSPPPFKKPCRLSSVPAAGSASRLLPCKDREYDPDKHCGVLIDEVHKNCTRSLTCKTHALSLRRKVGGRTKPFDQLLKEHREAKEAALLSKQKSGSPLPQHSLHLGRVARTPPSLSSSSSSHSPRSTSGSVDPIDAIRLPIGTDSASSGAGLSQHRQPNLPEGYLSHHPRPLAVNTFGVRLNGCTYLLSRKADLLRSTVQATLEQRQLHLVNPARKISQAKGSSSIFKDGHGCGTGSAALDAPSNGLASSKTSASLSGSVAHGVPVLAAAATSNSRMAVLSPALRGVSLPLSSQAIVAAQPDGPAAKRAKMSDSPTVVASSVGTTAVVGQQGMQATAQQTVSGGTVAQPLLSSNVVVGAPGIAASRPLLATFAARQQQQQMLQQQQLLLSDTSLSSISSAGTCSSPSVTSTMTATLLALGGTGGAGTGAGGLMKFGSQAVPSASSLSNVSGKAPVAVTVGTSVGSGSAGATNAVLVTDTSASGVEKGGSVGVPPTTFLLTSCGTADNVRMKGTLVNGSIQMTTNASPIGALSHRAASGTTAIAATLLAPAHSAADSTTIGLALASTSMPNVIFRKPESFNAVTQSSTVGGSLSASVSSASGLQLSAVANQRHVGVNTAAAGQTAAIGALLGSGSALMAGQHVLQQQPATGVTGSGSGYPLHISSSSLKSLPQHATIRLVNTSQPHQTLRQQQMSPAVSLTIPLVGNPPPQPPSQQQQSAVHKAAAAQSSLSNLRV